MLSDQFRILKEHFGENDFTVHELFEILGEKSHGFIIIILALPFLLPIPLPGLSTILGLMIISVSLSWFLRKKIWLPQKVRHRVLHSSVFITVFTKGEIYSRKIEYMFKSRGNIFFTHSWSRFVIFILIAISALLLALPLPPGTNFPPALTLILLAMAILFEDFMLLFLGIIAFVVKVFVMYMALEFVWIHLVPKFLAFFQ